MKTMLNSAQEARGSSLRDGKTQDNNECYKVNLKGFMARCESNYRRLYRVFPDVATDSIRRLGLSGSLGREVLLTVTERTPYTTLLSIREQGASNSCPNNSDANSHGLGFRSSSEVKNKPSWREPPVLNVRMYHDARLAEVVSCDGLRSVVPKNAYPNKNMLQRDEKAQWNRFLEEWLIACIERGHVTDAAPVLLGDDV